MAGRTHKAVKNITYNVFYQLSVLILGFVNRTIFLYFLSVEYLGVQSVFKDILSLLSIADLGIITAMTYSMYKPLAEKDEYKIAGLVQLYKKICNLIALSIFTMGIALMPFLKYVINLDTEMPYLHLYYFLYLLDAVASYLSVYRILVIVADQKGYLTAKYGAIGNLLKNIFLAVFLWLTHNFLVYLIIQLVFTYGYNIFMSYKANNMYPYINKKIKLPKEETNSIFNNIKSVFIYKISSVLVSATDNTLTSIIVGTVTVGLYSNYMMVVTRAVGLLTTVFQSMASGLGNLVVKENENKRYEVFQIIQTICNMLSVFVSFMILFLIQDFIVLWLGRDYLLDNAVVYAIIINFYFSVILLPVWAYREATGLYNQIRYVMLITAGLNLIISVVLGKMLGLAGILLATSISKILTYFWYEPIILYKNFFATSSMSYFKSIMKSILVLSVLILTGNFISSFLEVTTFISLIIKGIVLAGISIIFIIVFYHQSPGFKFMQEKAIQILRKLK